MRKWIIVFCCLYFLTIQLLPGKSPEKGESPPNIVFIITDDLDFDEIGVYDYKKYPCRTGAHAKGFTEWREDWRYYEDPRMHTPNIDSLARDGAMFERFYVTSSVCSPSRYSFMTGRYGSRSRPFLEMNPPGSEAKVNWSSKLGPDESNLARILGSMGYLTGLVGKWHLGFPRELIDAVPPDSDPSDPKIEEQIKTNYARSVEYMKNEIGFDEVDRLYMRNKESKALGLPDSLQHHNLEWITEGALEFLERYGDREQPFFLYMALSIPHSQFDAIYGEFKGADPLATTSGLLDKPPNAQPARSTIYDRLEGKGIDPRNAMGTWMDDSVGAVLDKLESLGISENTVVVFTSDHQSRGKFTCYEGNRVPFLLRWPEKIKAGTRIDSLCANIDVVPTFLEMAGESVADSTLVDGRSLMPVLSRKKPQQWRNALLLESGHSRAVVTQQWKYLANRPPREVVEKMDEDWRNYARTGELRHINWTGRDNPHDWGEVGIRYVADVDFPHFFDYDQLYNLEVDPFEQVNLADYPKYREVLEAMKSKLEFQLQAMPHAFGEFN